jgi:hypothetical protein
MFSQMHFPLKVLQLSQLQIRSGRGLGGRAEMSSGEQRRSADLCDFGFMQCCWWMLRAYTVVLEHAEDRDSTVIWNRL